LGINPSVQDYNHTRVDWDTNLDSTVNQIFTPDTFWKKKKIVRKGDKGEGREESVLAWLIVNARPLDEIGA
jgi:hypothetical protein